MNALLVFDISGRDADVKFALRGLGYYSSWSAAGIIYNLPKNVMWKPNIELPIANSNSLILF